MTNLKMYKKIILNIPYSSMEKCYSKWNKPFEMFPLVKKLTNWHSDLLFSDDLCTCVRFPFSILFCDVEKNVGDESEKEGRGIIYSKIDDFNKDITDVSESLQWYNLHRGFIHKSIVDDSIIINCHTLSSKDMLTEVRVNYYIDNPISQDELDKICTIFENNGYSCSIGMNRKTPYENTCNNFKCIDIEINRKAYMDEKSLLIKNEGFSKIKTAIKDVYKHLLGKKD